MYRLVSDFKYVFLSCLRRFGKSLLTSTLECYFAGKKELFKGLAVDGLEKEWKRYPVIHFDFSDVKEVTLKDNLICISHSLGEQERKFGLETDEALPLSVRLSQLISAVCQLTGERVVLLIDEYDAPLLNVLHLDDEFGQTQTTMRALFSPLKKSDSMLRFVFITGITKFAQLSIFSELNNIKNVSMLPDFSTETGTLTDWLIR